MLQGKKKNVRAIMQALINSSGFVQCWCISNRVHKPMSMCYLSDFLIDCSENRGVKKIYKRNSKAITQFFDGWNGDALLGGIKHTVNGGRSDTGTDSKGIGTYVAFLAKLFET